jgi:two-component system, response regulator PdtaR
MQGLKILIIEDENIIANDIKGMLLDWGYSVVGIVPSGEEAIPLFTQELPDMAIIDVQLSGDIDGIETAKKLNAIQSIPIIYLTAQADALTVERAKATRPAAYLLKPFDERNLHISLELAISNFVKNQPPQLASNKEPVFAHEVKLSADIILKKDDNFFIKQNYRFVKLKTEDLIYIEADRNYVYLVMKKQKFIIRMPLAEVLERLNCPLLVRVHRSYAVNIQCVEEFDETEIIVNAKSIPLTASYKDDFLKKFNVV